MHPALHSWREELAPALVRVLAYVGGTAVLSIAAAHIFQSPPAMSPIAIVHSPWVDIDGEVGQANGIQPLGPGS